MSNSIQDFAAWMKAWRSLCESQDTTEAQEHEQLDRLEWVVSSMIADCEYLGLDAADFLLLQRTVKQHSDRFIDDRVGDVDRAYQLSMRICRAWENHEAEGEPEPPEPTYDDQVWKRCFRKSTTRTIRDWRSKHGFPPSPATLSEVKAWCESPWAQQNRIRLVENP